MPIRFTDTMMLSTILGFPNVLRRSSHDLPIIFTESSRYRIDSEERERLTSIL